ncbi:beta-1,4-galactosyltransferase galt-1-like [Halichondria panicea]|uniref:beta-1,4-galactosyltransferase galt-1-like n=1 Tax=Halichondria panicea TaxID=6063 RepID=UPI00312B9E18
MSNYKLKKTFIGSSSLVIILIGIFYIHQYTSRPLNVFARSDTGTNSSEPSDSSMVIRSAYIDTRARNGRKHPVLVIFAETSMEIRKHGLIEGCGADSINAKAFEISTLYFPWINQHYPKLTHEEVMIDCYDLEVHENSTAFVRYRPLPNSKEAITGTIDITYPARRDDYKDKVVVCTNCFGKPPWLSEWLKYQKTIGVDLVQLYVEEQFMSDNENLKIVESYIQEGFLKVENRKTYFDTSQINYHSQLLNYHDCLYRYREVFEFAFFLDTDDFFIPRFPNKTNVHDYVNQFFTEDNQVSAEFVWLKYFPDCGLTQPLSNLKDGNITRLLKVKEFWTASEKKFVCRPTLTTSVGIHSTAGILEGTTIVHPPGNVAYIAHVRAQELLHLPRNANCKT